MVSFRLVTLMRAHTVRIPLPPLATLKISILGAFLIAMIKQLTRNNLGKKGLVMACIIKGGHFTLAEKIRHQQERHGGRSQGPLGHIAPVGKK